MHHQHEHAKSSHSSVLVIHAYMKAGKRLKLPAAAPKGVSPGILGVCPGMGVLVMGFLVVVAACL